MRDVTSFMSTGMGNGIERESIIDRDGLITGMGNG